MRFALNTTNGSNRSAAAHVKSHGGADVRGFATAIERAYDEARHDLIAELTERVAALNANTSPSLAASTAKVANS